MNRCGCNPIQEKFEFEIVSSYLPIQEDLDKLFPIEKDLNDLKKQVICNFLGILDKLECGIQEDLECILEDISYIYIKEKLFQDNTMNIPPSYIGFSLEENPNNLDLNNFNKKFLLKLEFSEQIPNTESGSYLWIISPYALNKVAVDEGFTYPVKMNPIEYKNGLHYYRSNSKIDVCNLTYYIK